MAAKIIRVVVRSTDGELCIKDHDSFTELEKQYEQVGIDDCSTDLSLRGMPVFRGLIGPIPESKTVARYEAPEVFEMLTKEWSKAKSKRRRRRSASEIAAAASVPAPAMVRKQPQSAESIG